MNRLGVHTTSILAGSLLIAALTSGCKRVGKEAYDYLGIDRNSDRLAKNQENTIQLASNRTVEVVEGEPILLTVFRDQPDSESASIDYFVAPNPFGNPATARSDYRPAFGTLTWGPDDGEEKEIRIDTLRDDVFEQTEHIVLYFANVSGAWTNLRAVDCDVLDSSTLPKLAADVTTISAQTGGAQRFALHAGVEHARRRFIVAGSLGSSPGFLLGKIRVPLNLDAWFDITTHTDTATFRHFRGVLGIYGEASAAIHLPPMSVPAAIGTRLHHAYLVYDDFGRFYLASNAVPLTITP